MSIVVKTPGARSQSGGGAAVDPQSEGGAAIDPQSEGEAAIDPQSEGGAAAFRGARRPEGGEGCGPEKEMTEEEGKSTGGGRLTWNAVETDQPQHEEGKEGKFGRSPTGAANGRPTQSSLKGPPP